MASVDSGEKGARQRRGGAAAAVLLVLSLVLGAGCGGSGGTAAPTSSAPAQVTTTVTQAISFPDLVARIRTGVVRIEVETCDGEGVGTGILIGPRRIATVEHVVDGAAVIRIKRGGKLLATATVVGDDRARDLALLKTSTDVTGYHFELSGQAPRLGDAIAVLGYPLGLPLTVTRGSVSGLDRTIPIEDVDRRRLVQIDAAVNPGNSGGPLIIAETGQVVGLVDLGTNEANGIAFAVSAQVARPLLEAWQVAPQPVPPASCGLSPQPQPQPQPPSQDVDLATYTEQIDGILSLSASGRGDVGAIVTRVKQGDTYLEDGAVEMNGPIANRQQVLQQIAALPPAPPGAAGVADALQTAIEASLDADVAYRTWMENLPDDPDYQTDGTWENGDFDQAQSYSGAATRAKAAFVARYNGLAQRFGLRTWAGGEI